MGCIWKKHVSSPLHSHRHTHILLSQSLLVKLYLLTSWNLSTVTNHCLGSLVLYVLYFPNNGGKGGRIFFIVVENKLIMFNRWEIMPIVFYFSSLLFPCDASKKVFNLSFSFSLLVKSAQHCSRLKSCLYMSWMKGN